MQTKLLDRTEMTLSSVVLIGLPLYLLFIIFYMGFWCSIESPAATLAVKSIPILPFVLCDLSGCALIGIMAARGTLLQCDVGRRILGAIVIISVGPAMVALSARGGFPPVFPFTCPVSPRETFVLGLTATFLPIVIGLVWTSWRPTQP